MFYYLFNCVLEPAQNIFANCTGPGTRTAGAAKKTLCQWPGEERATDRPSALARRWVFRAKSEFRPWWESEVEESRPRARQGGGFYAGQGCGARGIEACRGRASMPGSMLTQL